ncbi:MAG: Amidophosphoribosyltransferase [Acidobacteria bacterium]|nr:Amidophosphoribosyltransferase [Acidobacteriota bacterium]
MGGFFGVASKADCVADLYYGTDYHSHLGTRRGGMVTTTGGAFKRTIHDITNAPFRTKFEEELPKHQGSFGLGVISDYEDQPLVIGSHHGVYALTTVGRLNNLEALVKRALGVRGAHLSEFKGSEFNPTEVVATLINQQETIVEGIRWAQDQIQGSCSMLLMTPGAVYAARDRFGRTPVVIGGKKDACAVTLESSALANLGYDTVRDLGPGEVVRLTPGGIEQLAPPGDRMQVCAFLWIYYGYPASTYEGVNTEVARNRCGEALARRDTVDADIVAGIPDSGIGHAIGYSTQSGIPYRRPFVKYTPTWPRSFMPQDQGVRDLVARMKLIPIRDLIAGKRILFCEDSIVRGTQLRDIITRVFDHGAREVHMRPACPPLIHGCPFLNFSRSRSEMDLAARRAIRELEGDASQHLDDYADLSSPRYAAMVERIRTRLGLTSLRYQTLPDMVAAIGLPRGRLCTYCWDAGAPSPRLPLNGAEGSPEGRTPPVLPRTLP